MPDRAILSAGAITSPRRISAFSLALTIHIVAILALAWLVDRPVPMPMPRQASAARSRSANEGGVTPSASRDRRSGRERQANAARTTPADSVTSQPRRVLDLLRDGAIVVAARIGLVSAPQPSADAAPDAPLPSPGVPVPPPSNVSSATERFVDVASAIADPSARGDISLVPLPPGTRFITGQIPVVLLLGEAYKMQAYPLLGGPRVMWLEVPDISRRAILELRPTVGWWSLDTPLVQPFKLVGHLRTFQVPASATGRDTDPAGTRSIDVLVVDRIIGRI